MTTNKALLYRPSRKTGIATAFTIAAAIHLSAVAFASRHREPVIVPPPGFTEVNVEPPSSEPPVEPDKTEKPPPLDPARPPDFVEPEEPVRTFRRVSPIRPHTSTAIRNVRENPGKPQALRAPRPEYPYEARSRRITGSGLVTLQVDSMTGQVINATITQSTGSNLLDSSALSAFRRWSFVPGTPSSVRIPFTFTLTGVVF